MLLSKMELADKGTLVIFVPFPLSSLSLVFKKRRAIVYIWNVPQRLVCSSTHCAIEEGQKFQEAECYGRKLGHLWCVLEMAIRP